MESRTQNLETRGGRPRLLNPRPRKLIPEQNPKPDIQTPKPRKPPKVLYLHIKYIKNTIKINKKKNLKFFLQNWGSVFGVGFGSGIEMSRSSPSGFGSLTTSLNPRNHNLGSMCLQLPFSNLCLSIFEHNLGNK